MDSRTADLNAADSDGYADAEARGRLRIPQSTLRRWARLALWTGGQKATDQ